MAIARKKKKNRVGASFKQSTVKSDKLSAYHYDSKPSNILKTSTDDGKMSRADTELKRMVGGDVFRSASKSVKATNSNSRRYK